MSTSWPTTATGDGSPGLPDAARQHGLRRIKRTATLCLLAAAGVYVVAVAAGGPAWVGYLRAAAEAAMIGGLADWFAVTALFRRPLGLPIPHTALIPTRKDALGASLADFVGTHFLSVDVVRERIEAAAVARRLGDWLVVGANAERLLAELAVGLRGLVSVLRDDDVRAVLSHAVLGRLSSTPLAPVLGRLLQPVLRDGAHHALVDVIVQQGRRWLEGNRETVVAAVTAQAPEWSPRFLDARVAGKVYAEVLRVVREVEADPHHEFRGALDALLLRLAEDLAADPATIARVQVVQRRLLDREDVQQAFGELVGAGRRLLLDLLDDPGSGLRLRAAEALAALGGRLSTDPVLAGKVSGWAADAAAYVVAHYRGDLTALITDTVARWDGEAASRRIESHVGRDLQYIRINGTVVGALAGLVLHGLTELLAG